MTNRRLWFLSGLMVALACNLAGCGQQEGDRGDHVGPASNSGTGAPTTSNGVPPAATGGGGPTTGTGGAAGTNGGSSTSNGVSATWTFPALVTDATGATFPTYLAHLLGR